MDWEILKYFPYKYEVLHKREQNIICINKYPKEGEKKS